MTSAPAPAGSPLANLLPWVPAYALGALDTDELREFEASLGASPQLCQEIETFAAVTAALALLVVPIAPCSTLKQALMASI